MSDKILQNKLSKLHQVLKEKLTSLQEQGVLLVDLNTGKNDIENLTTILVRQIESVSQLILIIK
jgi:hypothetical protein